MDAKKISERFCLRWFGTAHVDTMPNLQPELQSVIEEAKREERRRCAKIAEKRKKHALFYGKLQKIADLATPIEFDQWISCADNIVNAIRESEAGDE